MRKNTTKPGPSGMSRNDAFTLFESWGGRDCLLHINDTSIIREIKVAMGGDSILEFTSPELSTRAQDAYDSLGILNLTFENVWPIFVDMLPLVFPRQL